MAQISLIKFGGKRCFLTLSDNQCDKEFYAYHTLVVYISIFSF
jgi:hypothetical protein